MGRAHNGKRIAPGGAGWGNERGMVLVTSLLFLAILSVAGTTAYLTASNELTISGNYRVSRQAFYDADAGVAYVLAKIEEGLANNSLALSGSTVNVDYPAPSGAGFSFDTVTTLTQVITGYRFQVTGNAGGGKTTLEVVFERDPAMQYGVFGDEAVDMKSSGHVYSYDSGTTPNPAASDTTHEGDVGSNKKVIVHNGTDIDGNIGLGEDAGGTDAVLAATGTPIIYGAPQDVSRVNPDPLGAVGGSLAATFTAVAASNDNASAGASAGDTDTISGNTISLGNGDQITLTAGDYYLTDITLNNGSTLVVDTSGGPVNIYLSGALEAKNGSGINVSGVPTNFSIFSNSTSSIVFKHNSSFKGTVYAPYAGIEMKNGSDTFGILWGKTVDIKNSGEFFYDTALKDKWKANTVSVVSWRDTRY